MYMLRFFESQALDCPSCYLSEAAVLAALNASALLPVLDELAAPGRWEGGVTALIGGAVREAAVSTLEFNAHGWGVVPELRAEQGVRSVVVLNPVDKVVDDVVAGSGRSTALAEHPSTSARDTTDTAVSHTGDTVKTEEVVNLLVGETHLLGDLEVVTLGVGARGHRVSHAVVHHHLAAGSLEAAEVGIEGTGSRAERRARWRASCRPW